MADIFISYKREERHFAEQLSIVLEQLGFEVWWDFDLLSGDRYRSVIRAVIDECKAAIVLWSTLAVDSDFVMDEAEYAKAQGKLCPVRIDDVPLPFGFGSLHADDLTGWDSELFHPQFQSLVRGIEAKVGKKGKLGGLQQTGELQAASAEMEAFKAAQIAANPSSLRAFLNMHPRGAFAGFVRRQLEEMESETRKVVETTVRGETISPPKPRKPRAPRPDPVGPTPVPKQEAPRPQPEGTVLEPRMQEPKPELQQTTIVPPPVPPRPVIPTWAWFVLGIPVLILVLLFFIGLAHPKGGGADSSAASASPSAEPAASSAADLTDLAKPLLGAWAPTGLNCGYAVTITADSGSLSEASSGSTATSATIEGAGDDGAVKVKQSDGSEVSYAVSGDTLTKTTADGQSTQMTRCPASN